MQNHLQQSLLPLLVLVFVATLWFLSRSSFKRAYGFIQYKCGRAYATGRGLPKNPAKALLCTRKAAELGNAEAQAKLGWLYFHGKGVPQDYAEAYLWSRKAAYQRHPPAQALLGWLYFHGKGVPQDAAEAYFWLLLATKHSFRTSEVQALRVEAAFLLPLGLRAAIEQRANEW